MRKINANICIFYCQNILLVHDFGSLDMEDIQPTAKWANRMLRPLTSVYRRLEKHQETLFLVDMNLREKDKSGLKQCDEEYQVRTPKVAGVEDSSSYSEYDGNDPSWIPGKPDKRRIRHKYSKRYEGKRGRRRNRLSIPSPELQRTLPGAVEIATPLITGKTLRRSLGSDSGGGASSRGELPSLDNYESGLGRRATRTKESTYPTYKGSWKEALDMSGDTGFIDIARFLDRILIKFLDNTKFSVDASVKDRGARSLLSMAARRLPEFIEEEQKIQDAQDDGEELEVDMCNVYFTELEAHYAPSGNGWKPLRGAVRAQGIYLVSEMIRKKWVTKIVARRLLETCMHHEHLDAFETLLSRYLQTIHTGDHPTTFNSSSWSNGYDSPVRLLKVYYASPSGCRSFVFDEVAKLLVRGAISPEWMVTTSWKPCVDEAIQSLAAEDDSSVAAISFIEAVILSASGTYTTEMSTSRANIHVIPPLSRRGRRALATRAGHSQGYGPSCPVSIQEALNNLVLSLIAALCGMHIARFYAPASEKGIASTRMRDLVCCLALAVQRDIELRPAFSQASVSASQLLRRGYVLLGSCVLQCVGESLARGVGQFNSVSVHSLESFCLLLASKQDVVKELAVLVRQVICCYERATKCDRTHVSEEIRMQVAGLLKMGDTQGLSTLLGKVAVETAMSLAEATLDPDDHLWAADIQERFQSSHLHQELKRDHPNDHQHIYKSENKGLYRWEEGIGEWVERTPVPKMKKAAMQSASGSRAVRQRQATPSTGSSAPTDSPSGSSASSFTSSAPSTPSFSIKRGVEDEEVRRRPSKRLRSAHIRTHSTRSAGWLDLSKSQASNVIPRTATSYRVQRSAFGDTMHCGRDSNQKVGAGGADTMKPHTKVEVVIVNKTDPALSDETDSDSEEPVDELCFIHDNVKPVSSSCQRANLRTRRRATMSVPPMTRIKPVIPCSSDGESEDELSFLV